MKKIKNFPIISSKLRFINATVFKLGFLNSGFDQKSNGTRIFSPALKKRFQKPLPRQLFEIFFKTLIRTDRAQNVSVGVVSTHGRSQPKIKGGANFLKLIYSAVFKDGKKLEE